MHTFNDSAFASALGVIGGMPYRIMKHSPFK